jgi:hypothetical protein
LRANKKRIIGSESEEKDEVAEEEELFIKAF